MQLSVSRRGYKEFVSEGVGEGHREDFYQGREDPRVLGDDQFGKGSGLACCLLRLNLL